MYKYILAGLLVTNPLIAQDPELEEALDAQQENQADPNMGNMEDEQQDPNIIEEEMDSSSWSNY